MGVKLIKFLDNYLGTPIILALSLFSRKPKKISYKNILVIQLWGIGETLLTFPAISALKKKFPKSRITVLVTSRVYDAFSGLKFIDSIEIIKMSPLDILSYSLKSFRKFGLVIDFEEYLNISSIISFFTGKERLGYNNRIRRLLTTKSIAYNDQQHVVETHLDLVRLVRADAKPQKLISPYIGNESKKQVEAMLKKLNIKSNDLIIGIAPGAAESARSRMWPLGRYGKVAKDLAQRYNAKIIFVGGPDEFLVIQKLKNDLDDQRIINLAGKTSIKQLFCLIGKCSVFIGNDSGPMHIAASMGVKTIGLFGPNLPLRWGPFGRNNISIFKGRLCKHCPCINVHLGIVPECYYGNNKCMKAITVEEVVNAARKLVRK